MEVIPTSILEAKRNQLPSFELPHCKATQRGQVFSCTVPVVKNLRRERSKWLPASLTLLSLVESLELAILESDLLVRSRAPTDVVVGQVVDFRLAPLEELCPTWLTCHPCVRAQGVRTTRLGEGTRTAPPGHSLRSSSLSTWTGYGLGASFLAERL